MKNVIIASLFIMSAVSFLYATESSTPDASFTFTVTISQSTTPTCTSTFTATPTKDWKLSGNFPGTSRFRHASLVQDQKLWIISGLAQLVPSIYYPNDVWFTDNGTDWYPATQNAQFSGRYYHAATSFNNSMYMSGGIPENSEVWKSSNGVEWNLLTSNPGFSARGAHTMTVFKGKIWIIGGKRSSVYYNDVWSSSDGITWTQATANAGFQERFGHVCIVYNNKLWVLAGHRGNSYLNDVWCSENGIDWSCVTMNAAFEPMYSNSAVVYDNKMWIFGKNSSWYSTDGVNWYLHSPNTFSGDWGYSSDVFRNRVWTFLRNSVNQIWFWPEVPLTTETITPVLSPTPSATITETLTQSPTFSVSPTFTISKTITFTSTSTGTFTSTPSHTISSTHSVTSTITQSLTITPTLTITFTFTPILSLNEAVDHYENNIYSVGNALWFNQNAVNYFDSDSAQSGDISDNQQSIMTMSINGPYVVDFWWSVSSESGFDYLNFYVDSVLFSRISGSVGWSRVACAIPSGLHEIKWVFKKDTSVSKLSDCGWIDKLTISEITPTVTVTETSSKTPTIISTACPTITSTMTATVSLTVTYTPLPFVTATATSTVFDLPYQSTRFYCFPVVYDDNIDSNGITFFNIKRFKTIRIYNIKAEKVFSIQLNNEKKYTWIIKGSGGHKTISDGIYICVLTDKNNVSEYVKIIIR